MAQGLQTLAGKLNETKSAIETVASKANGGVNTSVEIGIVALIFALIAIAISALNMFRKKGGNNKQNS